MFSELGQTCDVGLFKEKASVLSCGLFLWRAPSLLFDWILNRPQKGVYKIITHVMSFERYPLGLNWEFNIVLDFQYLI